MGLPLLASRLPLRLPRLLDRYGIYPDVSESEPRCILFSRVLAGSLNHRLQWIPFGVATLWLRVVDAPELSCRFGVTI